MSELMALRQVKWLNMLRGCPSKEVMIVMISSNILTF